jgi:hypothetical protein
MTRAYYLCNFRSQRQGGHSGFLICVLPGQFDEFCLCRKLWEPILSAEKAAIDGGCLEDNLLGYIIVVTCLRPSRFVVDFLSLVYS